MRNFLLLVLTICIGVSATVGSNEVPTQDAKAMLPVGIFLGKIEEGARIFTPTRLIPFDHPESMGHEFPTALQFHQSEVDLLVWLGEQAGLKLTATLERYPRQPTQTWWYKKFREIPLSDVKSAEIKHVKERPPVPGLRIVAFLGDVPVGFIVDTRDLSLEARGMKRATAMGLDMTRAEFLEGLSRARKAVDSVQNVVIVFPG